MYVNLIHLLTEGKPIPIELRDEEAALRQEVDLEDENTAEIELSLSCLLIFVFDENFSSKSHIDDEYANATEKYPKTLLTTSRNPSAPIIQFVKDCVRTINSGCQVISEFIESCRAHDYTDVFLVHEHHGVPDGLIISHLPFGPTAYFGLLNLLLIVVITVTRHDIKDKKAIARGLSTLDF
ncbi:U3 small nucleolar ribonucleoprotein protein IMP4 [Ricinus communis]|uniref:U3 small nucleolar ribonucleoprotein protein IMP4 n=1 Tax=Ricinus communis TaxID=3988 RepID=UPI00201AB65B|nr:U3 small nucleolar ribonucleoprotein protein IMP4 [Ricinus communis]